MNKKFLFILIQILISLVLLVLWFKFIDLNEVLKRLPRLNLGWVILAGCFFFVGSLFRLWRWELLLKPKAKVPFKELFYISFVSFFLNTLIPLRAGEFSKSFILKKNYGKAFSSTFPTVLIDRIIEFIVVATVAVLAAFFFLSKGSYLRFDARWSTLIITLPLIALILVTKFNSYFLKITDRILNSIFKSSRVSFWTKNFFEGFLVLDRNIWLLMTLLVFSILALVADSATFYFLFASLGIKVNLLLVMAAAAWFFLIYIIPAAPGQIGTTELGGTFVFSAFLGIRPDVTAAVVLVNHVLQLLISFLLGFYSLKQLGLDISSLFPKKLFNDHQRED